MLPSFIDSPSGLNRFWSAEKFTLNHGARHPAHPVYLFIPFILFIRFLTAPKKRGNTFFI